MDRLFVLFAIFLGACPAPSSAGDPFGEEIGIRMALSSTVALSISFVSFPRPSSEALEAKRVEAVAGWLVPLVHACSHLFEEKTEMFEVGIRAEAGLPRQLDPKARPELRACLEEAFARVSSPRLWPDEGSTEIRAKVGWERAH